MGPTALLPLRRKACWGFFRPKIPTALAGCEPTNLGTKGQHATSGPSKPYQILSAQKDVLIVETINALFHDNAVTSLPFQTPGFSNFMSQSQYVKWSVVQWSGLHRGVPWSVFMFGEVKWSWRAVKWSVVQWRGLHRGVPWSVFMFGEVKWSWRAVTWRVVQCRGLHRGVPWSVFMFGEVKWTWRAVKWSEVYTCGLTTLETRYSSICISF
jgi:hypothetical protein